MKQIVSVLNILDIVGPLFAVFIFLYKWKKLPAELKVVFAFCVVQVVCNGISYVMAEYHHNNYIVYSINTFASFLLLFYLFANYLLPINKTASIVSVAVFIIITALLVYQGDGILTYNSISSAFTSFIIVALCLYFFYKSLISSSPEVSIPSTAIFWCVVGIFTYFAGSFFIFITYKYIIATNMANLTMLWRFHNVLLFICSVYIIYGVLWKNYQTI